MRWIATTLVVSLGVLSTSAVAEDAPRRGGTLTYAITVGEPDTYDCHASGTGAVLYRLAPHYSTLLKIDRQNFPTIVGDLAESWTISDDGLTYRFKIRDGVRFHDGTALTAEDIKATFDRIKSPPPGVVSVRQAHFLDVAGIEVPDPHTVIFKLGRPNTAMLTLLASPWNCVYSAAKLKENPAFPAKNVLGTGPFKFVQHVAGSEWRGARNEDYYQKGKPYLDGFTAYNMAGTAMVNALAGGQIQTEFRGLTKIELERVRAARGDAVKDFPVEPPTAILLDFNTTKPPFNDARVRRAMSLAIDRWTGAKFLENNLVFNNPGGLQRAGSPYARSQSELEQLPGFGRDVEANRAEARRLLAEAGVSNLKAVYTNRPQFASMGVYLIDQWKQIGVTVTQDLMENAAFFAAQRSGNFEMTIDSIVDYIDEPSLQFSAFVSYDRNSGNLSRSVDREVDKLYEQIARVPNGDERKALVRALEGRLLNEAYMVPLFWGRLFVVQAKEVEGYKVVPSHFIGQDLSDAWINK